MQGGITPVRLALVLNGLIAMALVLAVSGQIYSSRQAVLERASLQAEGIFNQHLQLILAHLETIDLALYQIRLKLRMLERDRVNMHQVHEILVNERDSVAVINELLYLNSDGQILYSSEVMDIADDQKELCPPFKKPTEMKGYHINRWPETTLAHGCISFYNAIFVVVADPNRHGQLHRTLVAVLDRRYLEGQLQQELAPLGSRAAYQLINSEHQVLLGAQDEPPFTSDRIWSRDLPGFPLRLQIRINEEDVLQQNWGENTAFLIIGALLFQLVCSGASGYMVRMIRLHHYDTQQREQRFDLSLEYAEVGVWDWDIQSNAIIWSNQVAPMFGQPRLGGQLSDFLALIHANDRPMVQQTLEELVRPDPAPPHAHLYEITYRIVRPSGQLSWLHSKGSTVRGSRGEVTRVLGTIQDVTAQVKAQQALALSESRFRTAFSSTALGSLIIDAEGTIQDSNPALEKLFEYSHEELLGQRITLLIPDSSLNRVVEVIGLSAGGEFVGVRRSGEPFPIQMAVGRMEDEHERRLIASISDLTAIRSLELQLRRSQKMEAIGQLVGGISHDFNNILGIAIGHIELHLKKLRKLESEPKEIERMSKVLDTLWRGSKLTRNLLNFSRKESRSEEQIVNLNDLITETYDLIHKSLTSAIEVRMLLTDPIWPVSLNGGDFQDVLINMAINARDAMAEGGLLTIATENGGLSEREAAYLGLAEGDFVRLTIADNGCGIPAEALERVFEPFFTTKEKGKGTGLGLSMVYGFVQRSHGSIQIESEVGIGTAFSIYLPRASILGKPVGSSGEKSETPHGAVAGIVEGRSVLIVDDERELAEVAQHYFRELGYTTQIALNGHEALSLLEQRGVDLLFSDIVMPGGMNGCQLALAARRLHREMAILLTSGYTHEEGVLAPLSSEEERSFCYHLLKQRLPKPYNLPQLTQQIAQLALDQAAAGR